MKKLLYIILLLPLWATAQTNGTIQKTSATGTIRGSFGSLGLDTLTRVTGALVNGYILKYHAATNKWYASPDASGSGFIVNSTSLQTPANFNISATGQMRRANIDTIYSKSSRTLVVNDTLKVNKPLRLMDSLNVFPTYPLLRSQALQINGNIELINNNVTTVGRDIDFIKLRNYGPPAIDDEYGYINWRTQDSTGNFLPAIQMIGRVAGYSGTNYSLGNLEFRLRQNATYPGNKLLELTHDQKANLLGKFRVGSLSSFTDFDASAVGVNGNMYMYGLNSPRTIDFTLDNASGVGAGDGYGGIDFYGRTQTGVIQRSGFIQNFVGSNSTSSSLTGRLKFAIRKVDGTIDTSIVIKENAEFLVRKNQINNANILFNTNTSGYISFGQSLATNPYITADGSDNLYLGTNDVAALQITAGKAVKINQLTGSVTDMVTISTDGTLGRTAIPSGGGSVVTVGVASANGFGGSSSGGANPALTLTSTLNTPILASNGTALIAATTTGSGTTAVLSTSPTLTATSNYLNLTATGSSGYTEYKSSTSTTRGLIGNGSSILTGAGDSDFIIRSEGDLILANGNSQGAEVTSAGIGLPYGRSFYFNSVSNDYITSDGTTMTVGVGNAAKINVTSAGAALLGNPTAPTQTAGDNSTKIATTAYVDTKFASTSNRILKDWYTDANNVTTTETDLYDYTVPANTLVNNGDKLVFDISGKYASNGNLKTLKLYFGDTVVSYGYSSSGDWSLNGTIIRVNSTTYRITINPVIVTSASIQSLEGSVTNYTGTNLFKITGEGVASSDITAKMGYLEFKPAAL